MKRVGLVMSIVVVFGFLLLFAYENRTAGSAEGENYCFTCHTNARKLIQITREIEKQKGKSKASSEIEGEG
jgi:hypothetical protein